MDEKTIARKVWELYREKDRIQKELTALENELVKLLCPKEKDVCEPGYCVFRYAEVCPFLEKWRKILEKARVP